MALLTLRISEYFGFDSIPVELARSWGGMSDVWGKPLQGENVYPVLMVLPMVWSWSFLLVQTIHEEFLKALGFAGNDLLTCSWPAPAFSDSPVALSYCDNFTIMDYSSSWVNKSLQLLIDCFAGNGVRAARD